MAIPFISHCLKTMFRAKHNPISMKGTTANTPFSVMDGLLLVILGREVAVGRSKEVF